MFSKKVRIKLLIFLTTFTSFFCYAHEGYEPVDYDEYRGENDPKIRWILPRTEYNEWVDRQFSAIKYKCSKSDRPVNLCPVSFEGLSKIDAIKKAKKLLCSIYRNNTNESEKCLRIPVLSKKDQEIDRLRDEIKKLEARAISCEQTLLEKATGISSSNSRDNEKVRSLGNETDGLAPISSSSKSVLIE